MEMYSSDIELASGVSDSSVIAEFESIIDSSLGSDAIDSIHCLPL